MNKIIPSLSHKIWRILLVLALVLPASLAAPAREVEAGGSSPIPFLALITGLVKRNRVYREANSFIKDQAEYYDALRETARRQLLDREMTYGLRDNQVAAYTKVVALIEQERQSMYDFAESEKKAARTEFIDTVQHEITNRMLASTPATQVLGAMTHGINSSQGFLDGALAKLAGDDGGFLEDVAKVRRIAERIEIAGGVIGGSLGKAIRTAGAKVVELIDKPTSEIEADLIQVQGELGALGDLVRGLQGRGYQPTASQTTREVVVTLVSGEESEHPTIQAIVDMLIAKHGGGGSIRDRARDVLLGNASARCAARVEQIRQVIFRLEMDAANGGATNTSDITSCQTIDLTSMVEAAVEAEGAADTQPAPTAQAEDAPQEYVWTLASTEVNPFNEKTNFVGGGADPTWFPEGRFTGKSHTLSASDGSFSVHDVDVDHEYEFHNVTVGVNFTTPPAVLESGQEVELNASASSSGTVNEGGIGIGLTFQYDLNGVTLDPILTYTPWSPYGTGEEAGSWTFTAPQAGEGGEFTLSAGLWNAAPCYVIWTYQAVPGD